MSRQKVTITALLVTAALCFWLWQGTGLEAGNPAW